MNTWRYDIRTWYPEEATTFIGNGKIGGNLPIDGHGAAGNPYAAKLAAHYVTADETFAAIPHWLDAPLSIGGKPLKPSWVGFTQSLDLRRGVFTTSYADNQNRIRVTTETFCHRGNGGIAAYSMAVEALADIELDAKVRFSLEHSDLTPNASPIKDLSERQAGWELDWNDPQAKVAQLLHVESEGISWQRFGTESAIGLQSRIKLKTGERRAWSCLVSLADGASPVQQATCELNRVASAGYRQALDANVKAMEAMWSAFDLRVENPYAERRSNASMFYLMAGYRDDVVWGGTATGLSSKGSWGGSVLWDTEFYMFPAILPFYPNIAKNMLLYRQQTLGGAMENARQNSEKGARFAWQSKKSGSPSAGMFEDERHVSSDICFACDWYARVSGDRAFAGETGGKIISEVARNWASRITPGQDGRWNLNGVIPPDEHVMDHYVGKLVNNSVMTNAYASWVLKHAAADAGNNATPQEREQWKAMAAGLPLLRDEQRKIYLEYEGYDGHPIKQADVGHLFFPLCVDRDPQEIRRNINYYADRDRETGLYLTHSPFVYGCAMSRAGDAAGVKRFIDLTGQNITGPFEIPRESNYATGPVTTGAGSYIGLMLYAALGVENTGPELSAHPCVPEDLGKIEVRGMHYGGDRYRVSAAPGASHAGGVGEAVITRQ